MSGISAGTVFRRWFEEVWNERRADRIATYLAPDGLIHALDESGADAVGPAAFQQFFERFLVVFPDMHFTVHEVVEQGDMAAGRWTASVTHTGEGLGVPPTGKAMTVEGFSMLRAEDGKMVEGWNQWDRMSLAVACRMLVPPS